MSLEITFFSLEKVLTDTVYYCDSILLLYLEKYMLILKEQYLYKNNYSTQVCVLGNLRRKIIRKRIKIFINSAYH